MGVVFVVSPPLAGGGQNPCSFYLQDEGLVDSFQKRCTSEEQECSRVSKFIIKLQINYFVLKCLKFFFKYSKQQTLKYFLLYVTIQLIPQNAI